MPANPSRYYGYLWKGEAAIQEDSKESVFSLVKHGLKGNMVTANILSREWPSGRFDLKDSLGMEYNLVLNKHRLEITRRIPTY